MPPLVVVGPENRENTVICHDIGSLISDQQTQSLIAEANYCAPWSIIRRAYVHFLLLLCFFSFGYKEANVVYVVFYENWMR